MDNITVTPRDGDNNCMAASFVVDGARYHFWFDSVTMELTAPILYKNPLDGVKYKSDAYFDTRRLNANAAKNAALIAKVLQEVVNRKLVEVTLRQIQDENATAIRERHVTAFVRESWVSAMRGNGNPAMPEDISLPEFKAASRQLADRLEGK